MTIIEPLDSRLVRIEDELNRLAGTLIGGMPTLGKATAALWWLGHRELTWASHNDLTPNQATGGEALGNTEGFVALDGQTLEVVEGQAILGTHRVQVTPNTAKARSESEGRIWSAVGFAGSQTVLPWHIYTASLYTLMTPDSVTPSRPNWMSLTWRDAEGNVIGTSREETGQVSKQQWGLTWITDSAPENAATCDVQIEWQQAPDEVFWLDKAMFYNGSDPQAWAYPEAGAFDLEAGLRAHLNMKAGIFNPDEFVSVEQACNLIAQTRGAAAQEALSLVPTPNLAVVAH